MAGVRTRPDRVIARGRGIPTDVSIGTRLAYEVDEPDAHSESWMTGAELESLIHEWGERHQVGDSIFGSLRRAFGWLFGNGFVRDPEDDSWPKRVTDVRVVFWFDN